MDTIPGLGEWVWAMLFIVPYSYFREYLNTPPEIQRGDLQKPFCLSFEDCIWGGGSFS